MRHASFVYGVVCYVFLHGYLPIGWWRLLPLQWEPSHRAVWRLLGWCRLFLWWVVHYCGGIALTRGGEGTWVIHCVMQTCPEGPSISQSLVTHVEAGSVSYRIYAWDVIRCMRCSGGRNWCPEVLHTVKNTHFPPIKLWRSLCVALCSGQLPVS